MEDRELWWAFSAYTVNIPTGTKREEIAISLSVVQGRRSHFPIAVPMLNNTHSFKTSFTQGFLSPLPDFLTVITEHSFPFEQQKECKSQYFSHGQFRVPFYFLKKLTFFFKSYAHFSKVVDAKLFVTELFLPIGS